MINPILQWNEQKVIVKARKKTNGNENPNKPLNLKR
jgi:hypothetical protein